MYMVVHFIIVPNEKNILTYIANLLCRNARAFYHLVNVCVLTCAGADS